MTPTKLGYCLKGYKLQKKARDEEMWAWWGNYGISALTVAISHCFSKKSQAKYINEPILCKAFGNDGLTEEEIQEKELQKALLAEEQWIMASKQKGLPETII